MRTHSRAFVPLARLAAAAGALLVTAGAVFAVNVTVDSGRPVAEAILEIQKRSAKAITYEDPPYLYGGAIKDVTEAVRGTKGGASSRVLVPRGGVFTFAVPAGSSPGVAIGAVRSLVGRYNVSGGAATFSILGGDGFTHVVPREARSPTGRLQAVTPVLDTQITIAAGPRTGLELLEEICGAVSAASGATVKIGMVPLGALRNQRIALGADAEEARSVLRRLVAANVTPLSWRLLYDPGLKTYYLNLPVLQQP